MAGTGAGHFNLPDLRAASRCTGNPAGGSTYNLGQKGGVERAVITPDQLPTHKIS